METKEFHTHDHAYQQVGGVVVVAVAPVEVGGVSQHDAEAQAREGLLDPAGAEVVARGGRGVGAGHKPALQGAGIAHALRLVPRRDAAQGGLAPPRAVAGHKAAASQVREQPLLGRAPVRFLCHGLSHVSPLPWRIWCKVCTSF